MDSTGARHISRELLRSGSGIAGISMLAALVCVSAYAVLFVPAETLREWNNPDSWLSLPKASHPVWVNWFTPDAIPEHLILDLPESASGGDGAISVHSHRFVVDFQYADFPSDFIYEFEALYSHSPLLQLDVLRPDGVRLGLVSESLPYLEDATHSARIFSADDSIRKSLRLQSGEFGFDIKGLHPEDVVFSRSDSHEVLQGSYTFTASLYGTEGSAALESSELIVGGRAFGLMGTDELRRDLAIGLVWGTPLALLIGVAVAAGSVAAGLLYGVYAGYRGGARDETMMRLNDIVYALPALPFLIILAVTISSSIFVIIGFLTMFGWVGIAKVSRSMALQIRTMEYVEASQMMGQRESRIILRHILPQLLPYALASVAISVPAAITTEAGLSFLGLGDPEFPTWGQILHDANTYGAAPRGLWWWIVPPGVMIAVTGLAFVFLGNALDAVANPRLRRR